MRIDRIALKGFLSHSDTDWSPNGARLITLVGANGAGKSSLLDAVSYALFDAARARADDLVRTGATEMAATVEFAFAGASYRVTRGRTTRSGGKSFLELGIASSDGKTWLPLTGETIRETQQRIEDLLRLDEGTFATAVLLAQGDAGRFAAAMPADRKRVLGSVIGLDRYERASVLAREHARDLEAALAAERARLERIIEASAAFIDADQRLSEAERELAKNGSLTALAMQKRDEAGARLRDLAAALATVDAAEVDVRRIDAELGDHKVRWTRAKGALDDAVDATGRHTRALEREAAIHAAQARLGDVRARVASLEATERAQAEARQALHDAEKRVLGLERQHEAAIAEHETTRRLALSQVQAHEDAIASLEPVTCPECSTRFPADPSDHAGHLEAARTELAGIGAPPAEPVTLQRARAEEAGLRAALEESAGDPMELAEARQELQRVGALAATAGEMDVHRESLASAEAGAAAAREEMSAITAAGKAASEAWKAAKAKVDEGAALREERERVLQESTVVEAGLAALDEERRSLTEARARATADREQRDRLVAERDEVAEAIAKGEIEQTRWRKVATALGPSGIPARIIEGTVPELTGHINDVLGRLRPGMSLDIRTQRAKKAGAGVIEALDLVVRDEAGERPLAMYSGGERMSVSLAIAVGLSRLVARRAGTAIRTLLVDEPDGLDAESRRSLGQALKVLAHHGDLERIVVVTHTPDLAEYGDSIYQVSRNGAGSTVELVA